ncbi:MAG: hypothetical protein WC554_15165 [Clostridia bacterium]|jgi:hypothetical protein|nr:hypothetical protein [Clostridia bacterium]MDD4502712.1 hypothetical protein [Clostridia bacterium]NLV34981.1 hypothetical protein [Clostridiaceae bacterium]
MVIKTVCLLYYQLNTETDTVATGATPAISNGYPDCALDVGSFGYVSAYNSGKATGDTDQVTIQSANIKRRYEILNEYNAGRLYLLTESMKEPDNVEFTSVKGEWATAGLKYVSDCMVEGVDMKMHSKLISMLLWHLIHRLHWILRMQN